MEHTINIPKEEYDHLMEVKKHLSDLIDGKIHGINSYQWHFNPMTGSRIREVVLIGNAELIELAKERDALRDQVHDLIVGEPRRERENRSWLNRLFGVTDDNGMV